MCPNIDGQSEGKSLLNSPMRSFTEIQQVGKGYMVHSLKNRLQTTMQPSQRCDERRIGSVVMNKGQLQ